MDLSLVERVLNTERQVYGHIHKTEDKLTETGLKTLAENENASDGKTIQHALYDVKRELQIEAITGTVIGINCESRKERMVYNPPEEFNSIVPRETVKIDAELSREIHERLKEYKHRGILNDGDTVQDIASIHTREVRFSRAFVAIFEKIPHPMIVLRGFKFDSRTRERKEIYVPTAISRSTANFLLKQSINIDSYLIREDEYFKYLHESIEKFDLNDVVDIQTIQKVEEQNKEQDSLNKDILEEELSQIENIDEEVSN
jgi:hypothetical protein